MLDKMKRKNVYLSELGIPRAIYAGNFVTEKKLLYCTCERRIKNEKR